MSANFKQRIADGRCAIELENGAFDAQKRVCITGDQLRSTARRILQICAVGQNGQGGKVNTKGNL